MRQTDMLWIAYRQLQKNRKLEIQNLWQRSIFLGTFLVLCFTGYGALVGKMIDVECSTGSDSSIMGHMNVIAIFISLAGIIVSFLWIAMAKGSKAWQEVYENAIDKIEEELHYKCLSKNLIGDETQRDMIILSTKGGPYSPSRINIVIGQISLVIWFFIFAGHFVRQFNIPICKSNCLILIVIAVVVIILWLMFRNPYKKLNCFSVVSEHLLHKEEYGGRMPIQHYFCSGLVVLFIVSLLSCSIFSARIDDVSSRICNIENNRINTLEQQIDTAKTDVLSQLASVKTAMESRLEQREATITEFQSKDAELEKKISDLKAYADSKIDSTKDWASETFTTLEQYNSILSDISGIRYSIEKLEASMTSLENRISVEVNPAVDKAVSQIDDQVVPGTAAAVLSGYTETVSSVRNEMDSLVSRVATLEVMSR